MANNENDLKCAMSIVSNYTVNPQVMVDNSYSYFICSLMPCMFILGRESLWHEIHKRDVCCKYHFTRIMQLCDHFVFSLV